MEQQAKRATIVKTETENPKTVAVQKIELKSFMGAS